MSGKGREIKTRKDVLLTMRKRTMSEKEKLFCAQFAKGSENLRKIGFQNSAWGRVGIWKLGVSRRPTCGSRARVYAKRASRAANLVFRHDAAAAASETR